MRVKNKDICENVNKLILGWYPWVYTNQKDYHLYETPTNGGRKVEEFYLPAFGFEKAKDIPSIYLPLK